MAVAQKTGKPAVCPSCLILSHTHMTQLQLSGPPNLSKEVAMGEILPGGLQVQTTYHDHQPFGSIQSRGLLWGPVGQHAASADVCNTIHKVFHTFFWYFFDASGAQRQPETGGGGVTLKPLKPFKGWFRRSFPTGERAPGLKSIRSKSGTLH